jgi:hypothetical protein
MVSSGCDLLDLKKKWFWSKWSAICYGIETDNKLINTTGIKISPMNIYIAQFNQDGRMIGPYIWCTADGIR